MPSMHLGVASIYVLAARKTPWLAPAILFWLIIFVASAYFGYHYWVDGIVAAAVAAMCWAAAERYRAATPYRSGFRIGRTVASA
jgi:membrane-associated phospholipid phosphatase